MKQYLLSMYQPDGGYADGNPPPSEVLEPIIFTEATPPARARRSPAPTCAARPSDSGGCWLR